MAFHKGKTPSTSGGRKQLREKHDKEKKEGDSNMVARKKKKQVSTLFSLQKKK